MRAAPAALLLDLAPQSLQLADLRVPLALLRGHRLHVSADHVHPVLAELREGGLAALRGPGAGPRGAPHPPRDRPGRRADSRAGPCPRPAIPPGARSRRSRRRGAGSANTSSSRPAPYASWRAPVSSFRSHIWLWSAIAIFFRYCSNDRSGKWRAPIGNSGASTKSSSCSSLWVASILSDRLARPARSAAAPPASPRGRSGERTTA